MKRTLSILFVTALAIIALGCAGPVGPSLGASTIVFANGTAVSKALGSGAYTNIVSGAGDGAVSYSSGTPVTATVNAATGAVTLVAVGTTVITATKAATSTYTTVSASYTLTVTPRLDYTSANIGTLVYVPAGTFRRGYAATDTSTVSAFRMSAYELTVKQYKEVTGLTVPTSPALYAGTGETQMPVGTSWYYALIFCNRLSILEGLTPVYSLLIGGTPTTNPALWGTPPTDAVAQPWQDAAADWTANGYRLPTEMEWKWAAMGADRDARTGAMVAGVNVSGYTKGYAGSTETDSAVVRLTDYAWYYDNCTYNTERSLHPIGQKLPNELGLYDMTGNVTEWCWDKGNNWDNWPAGALTDYHGMTTATVTFRGLNGGWYRSTSADCNILYRSAYGPYSVQTNLGIRVVRP